MPHQWPVDPNGLRGPNGSMTAVESESTEAKACAMVVRRLVERFPEVDREAIVEAVSELHREYDGSRVRDFVPILVERGVRDSLLRRRAAGLV